MKTFDSEDPQLCPHCGNITQHENLFECLAPQIFYGSDGEVLKGGDKPKTNYVLLRCETCKDVSLYSKLEFQEWEERGLDYPSQYHLDASIPETVRTNYAEAKRIQNMSPNAFAVLLRRALEAVCDDRKVPAAPLARRLADLSSRGEIPGKLTEISTALRELGNAGAHQTKQKVTVPLTWAMDQFFRTLVEYVYVAPKKLAEFQRTLERYERRKG